MFELLRNLLNGLAVSFDLPILDWIAANLWCPFLDTVMPVITMFGDGGIFWIAISVILLFTRKYRKVGLGMVFALSMGLLVCNIILKPGVARIRPYDFQIKELGILRRKSPSLPAVCTISPSPPDTPSLPLKPARC